MKPGDFKATASSRILHSVHGVGLLSAGPQGLDKRLIRVEQHESLWCPPFRIPSCLIPPCAAPAFINTMQGKHNKTSVRTTEVPKMESPSQEHPYCSTFVQCKYHDKIKTTNSLEYEGGL
jgi:hypothetical protein